MSTLRIKLPIRAQVRGVLTLGPKPGTPLFEEEQRAKAEGRPFDYEAHGTKLYLIDDDDDEPTQPELVPAVLADIPPSEGIPG